MVSQLAIFFDAKPTLNPSTELEPLPPRIDLQRIYSDYMRYLLGHTQSRLVDATGEDLWESHGASADIVLTHPNLWDRDQRRFLKKAAIDAGLISKERSRVNLHFVEEAEAASRYYVSKYSATFGKLKVIVV